MIRDKPDDALRQITIEVSDEGRPLLRAALFLEVQELA
jgi:hypothetical protein